MVHVPAESCSVSARQFTFFFPIAILDIRRWAAAGARTSQRRLELALNHRLDELTDPLTQPDFDRVKSNQLSRRWTVVSTSNCRAGDVVRVLVMV